MPLADTRGVQVILDLLADELGFGMQQVEREYDMFIKAQLAADLLPAADRDKYLPGLGFYGLSPEFQDDRVDVTTRGFLALTVLMLVDLPRVRRRQSLLFTQEAPSAS